MPSPPLVMHTALLAEKRDDLLKHIVLRDAQERAAFPILRDQPDANLRSDVMAQSRWGSGHPGYLTQGVFAALV